MMDRGRRDSTPGKETKILHHIPVLTLTHISEFLPGECVRANHSKMKWLHGRLLTLSLLRNAFVWWLACVYSIPTADSFPCNQSLTQPMEINSTGSIPLFLLNILPLYFRQNKNGEKMSSYSIEKGNPLL